jgi:hypothetical protein
MSKETYVVNLEAPAPIIEKDSRRSDEVRQRLQQLDASLTITTFERGDLLAELKKNDYWRDYKFESFPDYVKKSGFDISPRQAEYEILISNRSKELGVSLIEKTKAKNSKLKVIYELDPTKTVTDPATLVEESMATIMHQLVIDAPSKTLVEIKAIVKRLKGETEEPEGELTWMNWPVRRDAKQVVTSAIELCVAQSGQTVDSMTKEVRDISTAQAIEAIMGDYLADPNNQIGGFSDESPDFEDESEDESDEDSIEESD